MEHSSLLPGGLFCDYTYSSILHVENDVSKYLTIQTVENYTSIDFLQTKG